MLRLLLTILICCSIAVLYAQSKTTPKQIDQDFLSQLLIFSNQRNLDSLEKTYSRFAKEKIQVNETKSGLETLEIIIREEKFSDTLKILAYKSKGIISGQNNLTKKRVAFEQAIVLMNNSQTLLDLIPHYQLEVAKTYLSQSKFREATSVLNKIDLQKETDTLKKIEIMGLSGLLYAQMDDNTKALSTLNKALILAQKSNDYFGIGSINSSMGNIFANQVHDNKGAIEHYRSSIIAFKKAGYDHYALGSQVDLGAVFLRNNQLDSAMFYLNSSYTEAVNIGSDYDRALSAKELGVLFNKLKKPERALGYCREAKSLIWDYTSDNFKQSCASCLSQAFEALKDYDSSLFYYKIYHNYVDSVLNDDEKKAIAKFNAELEKQVYIDKQEKLNLKKDQLLETRKITIRFLVLLGISSLVIFLLILTVLKNRKKRELLAQQEKSQRKYTQDLLQSLEKERKRFSMELHDSVGQLLVVAGRNVKEQQYEGVEEHIQNALNEVRTISQGMHPYVLEKLGLQDAIANLIYLADKSSEMFIESEIDLQDVQLSSDQEIHIYRILQELVSNSIKHSNSPSLLIELLRKENRISILVQDRGVGFNPDEISSNKRTSLGWKTLHERVSLLHGTIKIDSRLNSGTSISIQIPIKL